MIWRPIVSWGFREKVMIPQAVADELCVGGAPREVRAWMSAPPAWLEVVVVSDEDMAQVSDELDLGERAAIALAERLHADLLLIDETAGRAEARRRSLRVTGMLGVLRAGAEAGLVDVDDTTTFYVEEELLRKTFEKWMF